MRHRHIYHDLCEAIAEEYKGTACIALPVNDTEEGYEYPSRVRFELTEKDIESYRRAADTSIVMATASVRTMLQWLNEQGKESASVKISRRSTE